MNGLRSLLQIVGDLWRFSRDGRKIAFYLLALILIALGALILLTEKTVLTPFIYSVF